MANFFSVQSGAFASIAWSLLSVVGEEAINDLYRFSITVTAPRADIEGALKDAVKTGAVEPLELALLGQLVLFTVDRHGIERYGVVAAARVEATLERAGEPQTRVSLEVVPHAWLLTQRRNSRIFQHLYVHQIVSKVLTENGVNHRWQLAHTYPKRVYCVQYDETDYEFVTRLLAEEGIMFFFDHASDFTAADPNKYLTDPTGWETASKAFGAVGKVATGIGELGDNKALDTLNFAGRASDMISNVLVPNLEDEENDKPKTFKPGSGGPGGPGDVFVFIDQSVAYGVSTDEDTAPLHLTLRDDAGLLGDRRLVEFQPIQRVRSHHVDVRDYDFRRPMLLLSKGADATPGAPGVGMEAVTGTPPLDVYAHHGEYETPEVNHQLAELFLGQYRADALVMAGRGHSPRISPGFSFHFQNATATHLPEGDYAVIRVRHEWHAPSQLSRPERAPLAGETSLDPLVDGCASAIHEAMLSRQPLGEEAIRELIRRELGERRKPQFTYQNRFDCVPTSIAYRPPRPRRVTRNVTESATVVGPIGIPQAGFAPADPNVPAQAPSANEIYVDRFGRVKIQFHWDRDGQLNENSSCWVRVVQTWSGAGFGFQFIPRVGMEVLVTFLAGDPDRPVVIGSLYNATHVTPEPLPQRGTRSGIRTQSSPGGGGFNELSFEDQAGVERVYLHAQKDLEEIVHDTHTVNVKNIQRVMVTTTQQIGVGTDQVVAVGQNQTTVVGKDQSAQVAGNRTANVIRNETEVVYGNALQRVGGVAMRSVSADEITVVEGDRDVTVRGNSITQVGGKSADVKSSSITFVNGSSFTTATDRVVFKAEDAKGDGSASSIRLECGKSFIEIAGDKITLSAKTIEILGGDVVKLKGKDAALTLDQEGATLHGDPITLQTPKGSKVQLDGGHLTMIGPQNASVQGKAVSLKSGQSTLNESDPLAPPDQKPPNLSLTFYHGAPTGRDDATLSNTRIAHTKYRLVVEDLVYEGDTQLDGLINVWVPDTARVAHVVLWANETFPKLYPNGPLNWLVHLVKSFPDVKADHGAEYRLRNLGYEPGQKRDDPATAGALLEFQFDQEMPPTGTLEDETRKKLTEQYGN
jgi:type VI secretion system secreted protein VgrG